MLAYAHGCVVLIPTSLRYVTSGLIFFPEAEAYLDSGLRQAQPLAQLLPHEGVGVVRLVEEPLQLVQLLQGEVCAAPPLLQFALCILVLRLHVLLFLLALVYPCQMAHV